MYVSYGMGVFDSIIAVICQHIKFLDFLSFSLIRRTFTVAIMKPEYRRAYCGDVSLTHMTGYLGVAQL